MKSRSVLNEIENDLYWVPNAAEAAACARDAASAAVKTIENNPASMDDQLNSMDGVQLVDHAALIVCDESDTDDL